MDYIRLHSLIFIASILTIGCTVREISGFSYYRGYKLLRVVPKTNEAVEKLLKYEAKGLVDLWTDPIRFHPVDIFIPPGNFTWFNEWIDQRSLRPETLIPNIGPRLNRLRLHQTAWQYGNCMGYDMDWSQYNDYQCITSWMESLAKSYPDKVTLQNIGTSYEGNPIKLLWIHTGENDAQKFVWIDGGMHAREWISPAAITWVVSEILDNYYKNRRLVDKVDWYILPIANPDGYIHTWAKDRLWRKTRSRQSFFSMCVGVDPNRNFGYKWREGSGYDDVPCSNRYAGPSMFSERETKAIQDFITEANENHTVKAFVSVHSYSQRVIYPWGYTKEPPEDSYDMEYVAGRLASAMSASKRRRFDVFPLEGRAAGISIDWAKGAMRIPFSFIIEMRDKGENGFLLPDEQIEPASLELWAAIQELVPHVVWK